MSEYGLLLFRATSWTVQFALAAAGLYGLLAALTHRRPRWRLALVSWRRRAAVRRWLAWTGSAADSVALQERRVLLAGCGLRWDASVYLAARRTGLAAATAIAAAAYALTTAGWIGEAAWWRSAVVLAAGACLLLADRPLLSAYRKYRSNRIRREIVAVGRQLLYYAGSRLHLHGKLMRCLPYAGLIRGELQLLLNEWYEHPDAALGRFADRLGTEEAYGFAETIRSLRLGETEETYALLREVLQEYKARIELAKESRKETASYGLFVLAGIPILYTFQVFLYPWVMEAQRMFDSLNP